MLNCECYLLQRHPIDPHGYTHRCDNEATYVPKQRFNADANKNWQKVSDTTGRGYGAA